MRLDPSEALHPCVSFGLALRASEPLAQDLALSVQHVALVHASFGHDPMIDGLSCDWILFLDHFPRGHFHERGPIVDHKLRLDSEVSLSHNHELLFRLLADVLAEFGDKK